jgi:hypothetical protein
LLQDRKKQDSLGRRILNNKTDSHFAQIGETGEFSNGDLEELSTDVDTEGIISPSGGFSCQKVEYAHAL